MERLNRACTDQLDAILRRPHPFLFPSLSLHSSPYPPSSIARHPSFSMSPPTSFNDDKKAWGSPSRSRQSSSQLKARDVKKEATATSVPSGSSQSPIVILSTSPKNSPAPSTIDTRRFSTASTSVSTATQTPVMQAPSERTPDEEEEGAAGAPVQAKKKCHYCFERDKECLVRPGKSVCVACRLAHGPCNVNGQGEYDGFSLLFETIHS